MVGTILAGSAALLRAGAGGDGMVAGFVSDTALLVGLISVVGVTEGFTGVGVTSGAITRTPLLLVSLLIGAGVFTTGCGGDDCANAKGDKPAEAKTNDSAKMDLPMSDIFYYPKLLI